MTFGQISERMTRFEEAVFHKLDSFAGVGGGEVRGLARYADSAFDAAVNTAFLLDSNPHALLTQDDAARKAQVLLLCPFSSCDLFLDSLIQPHVFTYSNTCVYIYEFTFVRV